MKQVGKITSFYSFKGGVGRTMALANLGFLAALNGKKVLLIDWDLEAPGLGRYFQLLQGTLAKRDLHNRPGVLDLLSDWSRDCREQPQNIEELAGQLAQGERYAACVQPLVDEESRELLGMRGSLDLISAGAQLDQKGQSFADKLAAFSWPDFYEQYAGGYFLQAFQTWLRAEYDHILIDSRTGFAEAAGVCTLQMPDQVALCFVYNRQNIEGLAEVGQQIRQQHPQAKLFLLPMRTPQQESNQYSNAQALAETRFSTSLGLPREEIQRQLRLHAMPMFQHLPCLENLAMLEVDDCKFDPMSLRYHMLGQILLDADLQLPVMSAECLQHVRQRAQSKFVTLDYLQKLGEGEPNRAARELRQLAYSACNEDYVEFINPEYMRVLWGRIVVKSRDAHLDDAERVFCEKTAVQLADYVYHLSKHQIRSWLALFLELLPSLDFKLGSDGRKLLLKVEKDLRGRNNGSLLCARFHVLRQLNIVANGEIQNEVQMLDEAARLVAALPVVEEEFQSYWADAIYKDSLSQVRGLGVKDGQKEKQILKEAASRLAPVGNYGQRVANDLLLEIASLEHLHLQERVEILLNVDYGNILYGYSNNLGGYCEIINSENDSEHILQFARKVLLASLGVWVYVVVYKFKDQNTNISTIFLFPEKLMPIDFDLARQWLEEICRVIVLWPAYAEFNKQQQAEFISLYQLAQRMKCDAVCVELEKYLGLQPPGASA